MCCFYSSGGQSRVGVVSKCGVIYGRLPQLMATLTGQWCYAMVTSEPAFHGLGQLGEENLWQP